ncbi:neutrophil antibiotic peptide NP-5-like [Tamandua tetradactyla]|uniref:neutrophil antibiotic peptide NP-5-like n=1 Tax=Tamandua tetradactyla TaxID=48850 RepID=UPI00405438F1
MRAVPIVVAILLLAVQAQAEPLRESADEVLPQEMPEAQDEDVAISFAEDGIATREAPAPRGRFLCVCRNGFLCQSPERHSGTCTISGIRHTLCCRRVS